MVGGTKLSDAEVCRAADGSRSDLEHVLRAMEPQVRMMVAARLSPSPAQWCFVDDLTQQVLLAVSQGIARLEQRSVAGLKAFTSGIARRKVIDVLRGMKRRGGPADARSLESTMSSFSQAGPLWQFLSGTGIGPRTVVAQAEQVARLMMAMGRLKDEYRSVITMAFFDQLPAAVIAREMGISRPAASMLLIRAVKALRRSVRTTGETGPGR